MREDLVYFSDSDIYEMRKNGLVKKEQLKVIWEICEEQYVVVEATADGYYFKKLDNKNK